MKKILLIALAMIGLSSYAATTKWAAYNGTAVLRAGYEGNDSSSTTLSNYSVYFVLASTYSQNDLIAGLRDGSIVKTDFIANGTLAKGTTDGSGKLTTDRAVEFSLPNSSAPNSYSFYEIAFATVGDKEYMYASASKSAKAQEDPIVTTVAIAAATSQKAYLDAKAEFDKGGWYDVTAVPEPTSALLAMLGLAGLALRRKQK